MESFTVLVVTADGAFAAGCERVLSERDGMRVVSATAVDEAVDLLAGESRIDCVISDHDEPRIDGVAFLETVRSRAPSLPFVLVTSTGTEVVASRAISAGVTEYLIKERLEGQWDRLATVVADAVADQQYRSGPSGEAAQQHPTSRLAKRAVEEAPIGITIADADRPDTPLVYVNEGFTELTGYSEVEAVGRNCRFLQGANTDPEPVGELRAAIDADEPVTVELRNYRADGTEFWNRVTIAPLRRDDGEVTHYVGFQEDVTERVETRRSLRRFRRAVESAGHAIYMTDPDGTITYVNAAFTEMTGYDAAEAIGETPHILSSGEMSDDYYEDLWATITDGDVWEEEIQDRRKSGELYYANQTIAPITDDDGAIEAYVAIQQDTTTRKQREFRLRQYERAIEGAGELIAAVDDDRRYLFANEAYRAFHGLERGSVVGTPLDEGIGEDTLRTVKPHLDRALEGETVKHRVTRTRPNRSDRTFDVRYYPLTDDSGRIEGVVSTMRDLTAQIEREQHIASLDRMLRHNVRNELNVILGHTDLIRERASDDVAALATPIAAAANRIFSQADKERQIVELLSDPSEPTHLDLADVVDAAVEKVAAAHPNVKISTDVPSDLRLLAIPELQRAVEELIENAIVHAVDDPVRVWITATRNEDTVELRIADDGPGIPTEERAVLSAERGIDALTHSSGMGLWLVKRIVSRIDGDVRFEVTADGSVVVLLLPASRGAETHQ